MDRPSATIAGHTPDQIAGHTSDQEEIRMSPMLRGLNTTLSPPEDVRTTSWGFRAETGRADAARFAGDHLAAWGLDHLTPSVIRLAGELLVNARYVAGGRVRLTLYLSEGLFRCEVEDHGNVLPRLSDCGRWYVEGGVGPSLLTVLACCWGATRTHGGRGVWFEMPAWPPDHP
ncbi:hypothetical protein Sme01_26280 [Sphaerisporangium melleum]|uniref:Histidine kinase/HSP90-like ATPase domain-containing protein n=1 Tax=Sphaerisporangium melleum TaxID=321316 RepID=A0A917QVI6_9ACTN|nr:ATP-binding protein [Sphaerisporangium melleum]GGK71586.1 hypothetical protein GCM10007964_13050 [Sphaerisporangium melleum]GII70152.1 hypothetical protein Sme01_26280 [Sphaerisporangium melleum]